MKKLQKLLEIASEQMQKDFEKASIEGEGTPQEIADRNEGYVAAFLKKYFPFPYRVVKGIIIDSYGNRSNSIDCLILNPAHPHTIDSNNDKASVIFADGVDYAIEVKSKLNSENEISRALEQIRSVKKLRRVRTGILFRDNLNEKQRECIHTIPVCLFVNETYASVEHLLKVISTYYIENKVDILEQFDLIVLNNRALVYNMRPDTYINESSGRMLAYSECKKETLGLFLFELCQIPHSEPEIGENIMKIYLHGIRPNTIQHFDYIDKRLIDAGV